jgi:hypothetical protein
MGGLAATAILHVAVTIRPLRWLHRRQQEAVTTTTRPHHERHPTPPHPVQREERAPVSPEVRRRRWTIGLSVGGAFLGVYILGLVWFANALEADMQGTLQLAPVVQDTAHRAD